MTPVAGSTDQVPSAVVSEVTQPVFGVVLALATKQTLAGSSPVPDAKPPDPVTAVKETLLPGKTDFVSGSAVGSVGFLTVGEIVPCATWPRESLTM